MALATLSCAPRTASGGSCAGSSDACAGAPGASCTGSCADAAAASCAAASDATGHCCRCQDADFALRDGWTIRPDGSSTTYSASVPSTILGTLCSHGLYADAFVGTNYHKVINREDFATPWWYETKFDLPALKPGQRATLEFDGISYRADVFLNGQQIACKDQMEGPYRRFSYDVTNLLTQKNYLSVKLYRAKPGEFNIGFVDWNPRAADESMGLFREVWLRYSDAVSVRNTAVKSKLTLGKRTKADLSVETTLKNASNQAVTGLLSLQMEGKTYAQELTLEAGEERVVSIDSKQAKMLALKNPRLWWSHDLGKPELYNMTVAFEAGGKVSDSQDVRFGVRQIESYFTPEGHRGFILNGKKVLVKGAGWTDEIFLRNPSWRNKLELQYVVDMNLNAVRFENFWGDSQNLYDLCDELGLLALAGWSCFWEWEVYSGVPHDQYGCIKEEDDMDLIAASLKDQVLWLRNHPSIIAWYVGSDDLPRPELEKRYLEVLPKYDDRPYLAAAKGLVSEVTGPTGMKMVGPYDYEGPEYWYNPVAPGGAFGFNTETGIGAQMPVRESIEKMIPATKLWPLGPEYDFHCTTAGEGMNSLTVLKEVADSKYGPSNNLDEFLLRAHHIDYDGTRAMFEAFRVNTPRTTGVIQWMLNSAWPSLYWQLYDYFLQPTAGYYSVKKACEPQQLVYNYYDKAIYAVNNEAEPCRLVAEARIYSVDGSLVYSSKQKVSLPAGASVKALDIPAAKELSFLFLTLTTKGGKELATNYYLLSAQDDVHNYKAYNWIRTPLSQYANFTGLSELETANVEASVVKTEGGLEVQLQNKSNVVAFFVRLAVKDAAGELVTPAFWSENFINLQPGESRVVACGFGAAGGSCTGGRCSGAPCEGESLATKALEGGRVEISGWNVAPVVLEY